MLPAINQSGAVNVAIIGGAVPAGAFYNGGLAYQPDGTLYVKRVIAGISGAFYRGGLATTADGALYVADGTDASDVYVGGLRCRADGVVRASSVSATQSRGGIPTDDLGAMVTMPPISGIAAAFDANLGITAAAGFASQWSDISGNERHLLQATGAKQSIHLPFDGTKYGWASGVAANHFTTPSAAALTAILDEVDLVWDGYLNDYTTAAYQTLGTLYQTGTIQDKCGLFMEPTSGKLAFIHVNGVTATVVLSSTSAGLTDGTRYQLRAHWVKATALTKFYKRASSADAWTQIGTDVASPATSMNAGSRNLYVGMLSDGSSLPGIGGHYSFAVWNGNSESGGTLAAKMTPTTWTSGTTFVGGAGETWTINSTGAKPAQIVDRSSLLFDGTAHFMAAAFTLNQPETAYLVGKQVTWTLNDYLMDGAAAGDTAAIIQSATTPRLKAYAGAFSTENADMAVGSRAVVCASFNGASGVLRVNNGTEVVGNFGAANAGGITLGARYAGTQLSNIQVYEALIYSVAHDAATRANIIRALMNKWGVA